MIPPHHQLPAASILMVSAIALRHPVAHNLHNKAMLLFFYEINSSLILFTITSLVSLLSTTVRLTSIYLEILKIENSPLRYYSWVYDFSIFCSLWYKNTVCIMYQVRMYHTPAIVRYTTHTREPWLKLADFDTTISHSFLAQISNLRHRNPL
jgi:hypothetical protein